MAQPTNTFSSYDAGANREDLSDKVSLISPEETVLMTNIGSGKASATYHQWPIDALAAAVDTNAVIEGDDATLDAVTALSKVGNYTQISDKTAVVTGTQNVVDSAGTAERMAYQEAKKLRELKTDVEKQLLSNKASVAGNDTTARQSAGFESWITTNTDRGATGANGGFSAGIVAAPTDGTQRAFTETILKNVQKKRADAGNATKEIMLLMGSHVKTVASTFAGVATNRRETNDRAAKIIGAADMYLSDFGWVAFTYSQFCRTRTALFVDPDMASVDYLRNFQSWDLSKTGDTMKRQMIVEYVLRVDNEKAHGVAADLLTS
jgi:hypothetical protein